MYDGTITSGNIVIENNGSTADFRSGTITGKTGIDNNGGSCYIGGDINIISNSGTDIYTTADTNPQIYAHDRFNSLPYAGDVLTIEVKDGNDKDILVDGIRNNADLFRLGNTTASEFLLIDKSDYLAIHIHSFYPDINEAVPDMRVVCDFCQKQYYISRSSFNNVIADYLPFMEMALKLDSDIYTDISDNINENDKAIIESVAGNFDGPAAFTTISLLDNAYVPINATTVFEIIIDCKVNNHPVDSIYRNYNGNITKLSSLADQPVYGSYADGTYYYNQNSGVIHIYSQYSASYGFFSKHDFVAGQYNEASLERDGYTRYTCSLCDEFYDEIDHGSHIRYMKDYVDSLNAALEQADYNLRLAIQQNSDAIAKAITDLTKAYNDADEALKLILQAEIDSDVSVMETKMKAADDTLQKAIDAVSQNLETAKTELSKAINDGDTALDEKIKALDSAYKSADNALKLLLQAEIDSDVATLKAEMDTAVEALQKAIDTVSQNLETAKTELSKAINDGDTALDEKIKALEAAYKAADSALKASITAKIDSDINSLKAIMEAADEALQLAINNIANDLENTKSDLSAAIIALNATIANGDKVLDNKIAALDSAYKAADEALKKLLQTEIDADVAALKAEMLNADIALEEAIKTVSANLETAKAELSTAITTGDEALNNKIIELDAAYKAADEALKVLLRSEFKSDVSGLEAKMLEADKTLMDSINKIASDLAQAEADLSNAIINGDKALEEKIAALDSAYKQADSVLETSLTTDITALRSEMNSADKALWEAIDAMKAKLDKINLELKQAVANNDENLVEKITEIRTAMSNADTLIKSEILGIVDTNNVEISNKITALETAYVTANNNLEISINSLSKRVTALEEKLAQMNNSNSSIPAIIIIAICIIGILSLVSTVFALSAFISKKKNK